MFGRSARLPLWPRSNTRPKKQNHDGQNPLVEVGSCLGTILSWCMNCHLEFTLGGFPCDATLLVSLQKRYDEDVPSSMPGRVSVCVLAWGESIASQSSRAHGYTRPGEF